MRFDIRYRTAFTYEDLVRESQNELRACPTSDAEQELISYRVVTSPSAKVYSFTDYWGTRVDAFGLRLPHIALEVVAEASVETHRRPLLTVAPHLDVLRDAALLRRALGVPPALAPRRLGLGHRDRGGPPARDHRRRPGQPRARPAPGHGCPAQLRGGRDRRRARRSRRCSPSGKGVCQDYAHVAVALCRSQGIPARYVSGYLFTRDDRDRRATSTTATSCNVQTHAWFEAAIPGFGWLALDPTNQQEVGLRHVKIGHGRDYDDVQPFRGVFAGSTMPTVEPHVEIRRLQQQQQSQQ